jgi:hypothetical protein
MFTYDTPFSAMPAGYRESWIKWANSHDWGGFSYALLRVGMVVRSPDGVEIYIQPGDDETAMREQIDALDEVSEDVTDAKRGTIAGMMLWDYFSA